jgi:SPP1 gp7 family putative phage head morphogenesis protein
MATPETPAGGKATPFEPGLIERIAGAVRYTITGETPAWFGPNNPLPAQAPEEVKGRPFDFPMGVNLNYRPKSEASESGVGFDVLRRIADPASGGLDLMRIAIETRKDQMEAQRWVVRPKKLNDEAPGPSQERAKLVQTALRRPDLVHTFRQWQRQLLEDLLVIDAPTIYLRPMAEGFKIPEVMDGATIKILVDQNGRRPLPPEPAYQQIIKGLPANDYTLDELIYAPRNLRSHRFYGMSPVEQAVNVINLGLKRQLHLISYYTAGNIPEQLVGAPEIWNPDQIKQAQDWFDTILTGNLEARRKLIVVPGGMDTKPLKDAQLTDPLDEWMARIICWCFSISPSALVKDNNRATAQTNAATARAEGLEPLKEWWADVMNEVLVRCWGADDLEFAWADEEITDPKVKAEVHKAYVDMKVITPDEVREDLGKKPLTPEQKEELNPPPPPGVFGRAGGDELGGEGDPTGKPGAKPKPPQGGDRDSASGLPPVSEPSAEKVQKKKTLAPLTRNRPIARRVEKRIQAAAKRYLAGIRGAVVAHLRAEKVAKAEFTREELEAILAALPAEDREAFLDMLKQELGRIAMDGASEALDQIFEFTGTMSQAALDEMLSQANSKAIPWAEEHAARLVTGIDETTREGLRDLVSQAISGGWSNDELADAIQEATTFGDARCEMIARTETAAADIQGNLMGYRESGVVDSKQWLVAQDEVCEDCQAMDGMVVALDSEFPGGDPPLHPNCRCDLLPVLSQPNEEE